MSRDDERGRPDHSPDYPDEWLVAYLDGMLPEEQTRVLETSLERDASLQNRLMTLDVDRNALVGAFGQMLQDAPIERLEARLEETWRSIAPPPRSADKQRTERRGGLFSGFMTGLAFASLALVIGFGAGLAFPQFMPSAFQVAAPRDVPAPVEPTPPAPRRGWIAAVADYIVLYDPQTFSGAGQDPVSLRRDLTRTAAAVGVPLVTDDLVPADLSLKQAQVLRFNDKPLAQIMFADGNGTPIALCIIATENPDRPIRTAEANGLAAANWIANGHHYLVIGDLPAADVTAIADALAEKTG
ncbi:MAG: hypothetical protein AAGL24_10195 [Pseudomonadota bacterium]